MNTKKIGSAVGAVVCVVALLAGVKHSSDLARVAPPSPAPASVEIDAPAQVAIGELVVLSVEDSEASSFTWQVEPPTQHFMVIDGGKRAVFSSGKTGEYLFMVAAAKGDKSDLKTHKLTVANSVAAPTADTLGAKVAQLATDSKLPQATAATLATSFMSVSAAVSAGALNDPADIVDATKKAVNASLADNKSADMFLQGLQALLKSQAEAGKLPDAAAHVQAWREIATALNAYAVAK